MFRSIFPAQTQLQQNCQQILTVLEVFTRDNQAELMCGGRLKQQIEALDEVSALRLRMSARNNYQEIVFPASICNRPIRVSII
jgi:hypothetical protein